MSQVVPNDVPKIEFIDIGQLITLLPITRNWIYQRTRKGTIPCYRGSKGLVFDRTEVLAWFKEKQRHKPQPYQKRGSISLRQKRTSQRQKIHKLNDLNGTTKEPVALQLPKDS